MSVDRYVLEAAEGKLSPEDFNERFETWVPQKGLDELGVKRFRKGVVRELVGSSQARRYRLVAEADGIITISGKGNTRSILELALALEKPVLPVAFTGRGSSEIWRRNRTDLVAALRLDSARAAKLEAIPASGPDMEKLARSAASCIYSAAQRRCLVLMPFKEGHEDFYTDFLKSAIEAAGFKPYRIDKDGFAGDIPTLFQDAMLNSSAIVADITEMNPNVLYELGHLHAKGLEPMLLCRTPAGGPEIDTEVPFYLKHQMIAQGRDDEEGKAALAARVELFLKERMRGSWHH